MSRLDKLIAELCPDGVEYKELQDVLAIKNGSDYKGFAEGNVPVYGSGGIMAYVDRYAYDKPSVLIPRKGSIDKLYYVETPFWNVDTIFYTVINIDIVVPRYVYHWLLREHLEKLNTAGGVPSLTQKVLNRVKIAVPPLEVQREIVRVLDNFTFLTGELTAKLTAEFSARRKQYEYYSNRLLEFSNVSYYSLGELCDIVDYRGKTPQKSDTGVFLVTAKNIRQGYIDYEKSKEYIPADTYDEVMHRGFPKIGDVLITTEAPCGYVAQVDREDIALAQRVIKYRPKDQSFLDATFLKYILLGKEFQSKLKKASTGGTVKGIKGSILHTLTIPVPEIGVQKKTVALLNNFDSLYHSITDGMLAETEARQHQYEYYRDKILTFKTAEDEK